MSRLYEAYRLRVCPFCAEQKPFKLPLAAMDLRFHRTTVNGWTRIQECKALPPEQWFEQRARAIDRIAEDVIGSSTRRISDLRRSEGMV